MEEFKRADQPQDVGDQAQSEADRMDRIEGRVPGSNVQSTKDLHAQPNSQPEAQEHRTDGGYEFGQSERGHNSAGVSVSSNGHGEIIIPEFPKLRGAWWRRLELKVMAVFAGVVAKFYLGHPDQAELIAIKLGSFRAAWYTTLNEVCFHLGWHRSFRLVSVNLEVTNACNLYCQMCPVNNGMQRPKGMMEMDLFKSVIDQLPDLEFVLAFQWGEPMLHPRLFDMIRYASEQGIRTMITSNGTFLTDENIEQILTSGLDRITFSVDGTGSTHTEIRGYEYDRLKENVLRFRDIRDRTNSPIKIDVSMVVWERTEADVEEYLEEWQHIVDRTQLIPRFVAKPRSNKCRELWRGQLVVLWDGRVTVCCVDTEGDLILGDANTTPMRDLWNGERIAALRRAHAQGEFGGLICATCDEYQHPKVSKRFE